VTTRGRNKPINSITLACHLQQAYKLIQKTVIMKSFTLIILLLSAAFMSAQTSVILSPAPVFYSVTQNGSPNGFGCVFTYISGTTNNLDTFTDSTGLTKNQNPVVLSAAGTANIWIQTGLAYSYVVKTSGGTNCASGSTIYTVRGISGGTSQLVTPVTFSSTPNFPITAENELFKMTLTGNATAIPMTAVGVQPPAHIIFQLTQDGSGGHTFAWPSNVVGGITISSSASTSTTQEFIWDGTSATAIGPGVTSSGTFIPGTFGPITTSILNVGTIQSTSSNISATGFERLATGDQECWRNAGNTADICVGGTSSVSGTDFLQLGSLLVSSTDHTIASPAGVQFNIKSQSTSGAGQPIVIQASDSASGIHSGGNIQLLPGNGSGGASAGDVLIAHGVNHGNGFQHQRTSACTTGSSAGSTCTTPITWGATFDDTSYTVTCTISGETGAVTGVPYVLFTTNKTTTQTTVTIANLTAVAATGTLNCIGVHD